MVSWGLNDQVEVVELLGAGEGGGVREWSGGNPPKGCRDLRRKEEGGVFCDDVMEEDVVDESLLRRKSRARRDRERER